VIRAADHVIAIGVYPDMTERGWERDERQQIVEKVFPTDILVLASPIWRPEKSSRCGRPRSAISACKSSVSTWAPQRVEPRT
jgi:hypothetical protein